MKRNQSRRGRHLRRASLPTWPSSVFVALTMALLLVPLLGIPFASRGENAEKRELAAWPSLRHEDGSLNLGWLGEAGAWFEDHFFLRTQLVDADAHLKEHIFGVSSTTNVVVGKDGWLYYGGTLDDYQRVHQMSDQSLRNAAANLALMQEYVEGMGKRFVFAIAPNKNELYPEHMPFYLLAGEGKSNFERLVPLLDERGVNYVNLHEVIGSQDEVLYYARDSHWNEKGALVGYRALLDALGRAYDDYPDDQAQMTDEHLGDVELMLHPNSGAVEMGPHWQDSERFAWANEATSVEDAFIQTTSSRDGAAGGLVAYRDSFGNALLPYLATTYKTATFSKRIPYDMSRPALGDADDVIVERAERHLSFFATQPPYMISPRRKNVAATETLSTKTTLVASLNGPYLVLEGDLDPAQVTEKSRYFVQLDVEGGKMSTYEAFHVSSAQVEVQDSEGNADMSGQNVKTEYGYKAFVPKAEEAHLARVLVVDGRDIRCVYEAPLDVEG